MAPRIVVIAMGEMGSAVARRLRERGASVLTSLAGRSAASRSRAERAGVEIVDDDIKLAADADFVLSIIPPGQAAAFAERMAPALRQSNRRPLFADCNAVSPQTVRRVEALIAPSGCPFVDAGIIGGPPREGEEGPRFYASGPHAASFAALRDCGLDVRLVEGVIGTASALKLSYASLTKGLTALGAVMMLGAERAGVAAALGRELGASQPALKSWLERQVPRMYPKAYRWIAEMEEIATYLEADPAGAEIYRAAARLYERLAEAQAAGGPEIASLDAFTAKRE
jgi:3-hydroxyisobutyrate dehydrogenase-like beta-hydroxyacid dehydrogenase